MAIGPSVNTNIRSIAFPIITSDSTPVFTVGILAPSTGSVVYQTGTLLAQYTGGGSVGQFVNYDSVSGTNGQNVFVGVLYDDLIVNGTTVAGQVQILVQNLKGAVYKNLLLGTQVGDIAAAITQRNAKTVFDYNASSNLAYLIYGL